MSFKARRFSNKSCSVEKLPLRLLEKVSDALKKYRGGFLNDVGNRLQAVAIEERLWEPKSPRLSLEEAKQVDVFPRDSPELIHTCQSLEQAAVGAQMQLD